MMMEHWRECLEDVFDVKGLIQILRAVRSRTTIVRYLRSKQPSPFASSVLFNYAGNFIYDGDAPLAERRAATLTLDQAWLKELLGTAEFRELFDADVIARLALELQRIDGFSPRDADDLHDLLMNLGPLGHSAIEQRCGDAEVTGWIEQLVRTRRIFTFHFGPPSERTTIYAASEDAGRLRDAPGVVPPSGLAEAFLEPVAEAVLDLVSRYARTHPPFTVETVAEFLQLSSGRCKPCRPQTAYCRASSCLEVVESSGVTSVFSV